MKRTTLSLSDDLAQALAREAHRRSVSASQVARDALAQHLGFTMSGSRKLPFAALGRSGYRTTARDMEELLVAEWDDDARRR
jgi:hypothetical protein